MKTLGSCEVAIVGGGPVGLWLAASLCQQGVDVRVVERTHEPAKESRAIGIHPPGLSCLALVGVADTLQDSGVAVTRAHAYGSGERLGSISFADLPAPFSFVLTVPQARTEAALQERLHALSPGALLRDHACLDLAQLPDSVRLLLATPSGEQTLDARFVVGCDGKYSAVRRALHIPYRGSQYADNFLMGDVPDDTEHGSDAAVFLHVHGLVESFPLPGGLRRWVVATGTQRFTPDATTLAKLILERTGQSIRADQATMVSAFTAEHFLAQHFAVDRTVLAGDAAHVLSPIGGQGMNLGWLDAKALVPVLLTCLRGKKDHVEALEHYSRRRRHAAKSAIRRAELFMGIGRARTGARIRDALVRGMLKPWLGPLTARLFTMWNLA